MKRLYVRKSAGLALADLLVVVGLMVAGLVVFAGCWGGGRNRETANRVKCASNLRQIGTAIALYQSENRGSYPRTNYVGGATVSPTWGTGASSPNPFGADGPSPNDVSAGVFLLMRTQEITSTEFICPSSNAERWDFGGGNKTAMNWSNWPGKEGIQKHLSYSYQNPYPDDAAVQSSKQLMGEIGAEFAIAADINPGQSSGKNVLSVTSTSSMKNMRQGNSRNHDGDGQNVLFGDGHVEFVSNPFTGVMRDMIYARAARGATGLASSEVRNSSFDANDNVLLPAEE